MSLCEDKYVYHAVHMIFNGEFEKWDEEEPKSNKLVFIGKNLDAAKLVWVASAWPLQRTLRSRRRALQGRRPR